MSTLLSGMPMSSTAPQASPPPAPEVELLAALVEIADEVLRAGSREAALRAAAGGIRRYYDGDYVALLPLRGGRFRAEVFTNLESFDPNADLVRGFEAACDAAWPERRESRDIRIVDVDHEGPLAAWPLVGVSGAVLGLILLKIGEVRTSAVDPRAAELFGEHLGTVLETKLDHLRRSKWRNGVRDCLQAVRRRKHLSWSVAAIVCALLVLPTTDRVDCEAELQPVVRRHVAAPYDGILKECLAKPGDSVAAGQILGRLDSRELAWELAAASADRDRAAKSADVNLSAGKTAAAQIDRLESRRLAERVKLLESRMAKLDVVSPVGGVVVSGNLDRVEGAPIKVGQSLFEVAPLDRMIVELMIPEAEIDRARTGQEVQVHLKSTPGETRTGLVAGIFPRAETRDGANVFIAEVELDNQDGSLRPGMKASATLAAGRLPLAWVVVRRLHEMFWRTLR